MTRPAAGGRRRGKWWEYPRWEPTPTGPGYRSSKRAHAVGMRAGAMAFQSALSTRTGDCDEIIDKALDFTQVYLDADPELLELRATEFPRRPEKYQCEPKLVSVGNRIVESYDTPECRQKDKEWQDVLSDYAEGGAYSVIDREWKRMGCAPGKKLVVLPKGFGGVRRRRRRVR